MNWIKGATNNCDFLDSITDQFEVLSKEEGIRFQRQVSRKKQVRLGVRELLHLIKSCAQFSLSLSLITT